MNQRTSRLLRHWSITALATALLLAACLPAVRAQSGAAKKPNLVFCIIVSEKSDKDAVKAAGDYFASLKDNADKKKLEDDLTAKGEPPSFPNAKDETPTIDTERLLSALVLPQLGLADGLLSAALLAKEKKEERPPMGLASSYRWAKLAARESQLLGLGVEDASPEGKKFAESVKEAVKDNKTFVHPAMNWVLFGRATKVEGKADYFLLLRDPPKDQFITEEHLREVVPGGDIVRPTILIYSSDKGKDPLQKFTAANQPTKEGTKKVYAFSAIVIGPRVAEIWAINDEISDGILKLAGRTRGESQELSTDLRQAIRPRP